MATGLPGAYKLREAPSLAGAGVGSPALWVSVLKPLKFRGCPSPERKKANVELSRHVMWEKICRRVTYLETPCVSFWVCSGLLVETRKFIKSGTTLESSGKKPNTREQSRRTRIQSTMSLTAHTHHLSGLLFPWCGRHVPLFMICLQAGQQASSRLSGVPSSHLPCVGLLAPTGS